MSGTGLKVVQLNVSYIGGIIKWYSLAQRLKRLPARWETQVQSLGREDTLEKETATHSSILAWRIPWAEEPGRLPSMGSQRVGHDWSNSAPMHACMGGCESTSVNMNQPLHFAKQEWWSAFTKAASMLGVFYVSLFPPCNSCLRYILLYHFTFKKLKFSNVMDLVKCHTRSSRIRVQAKAYSTTDLSLFLLHPAASLRIITERSYGQKTPLTAVDGLFSLMAFREICFKISL